MLCIILYLIFWQLFVFMFSFDQSRIRILNIIVLFILHNTLSKILFMSSWKNTALISCSLYKYFKFMSMISMLLLMMLLFTNFLKNKIWLLNFLNYVTVHKNLIQTESFWITQHYLISWNWFFKFSRQSLIFYFYWLELRF